MFPLPNILKAERVATPAGWVVDLPHSFDTMLCPTLAQYPTVGVLLRDVPMDRPGI